MQFLSRHCPSVNPVSARKARSMVRPETCSSSANSFTVRSSPQTMGCCSIRARICRARLTSAQMIEAWDCKNAKSGVPNARSTLKTVTSSSVVAIALIGNSSGKSTELAATVKEWGAPAGIQTAWPSISCTFAPSITSSVRPRTCHNSMCSCVCTRSSMMTGGMEIAHGSRSRCMGISSAISQLCI